MLKKKNALFIIVVFFLFFLVSCDPSDSTIEVDCTVTDLVAAINTANSTPGHNKLDLFPGCVYTLEEVDNQADFNSMNTGDYGSTGLPVIHSSITIEGNNAIIRRAALFDTPEFRIFYVYTDGILTLMNLTVDGGIVQNASPNSNMGGGILSLGELTLRNTDVVNSLTTDFGGGIHCLNGELEVRQGSVISGNQSNVGGGISVKECPLTITESEINLNTSGWSGGGVSVIRQSSPVVVDDAVFDGNVAGQGGGGIANADSDMTITSSTFTNNQALGGGGLAIGGGTITIGSNTAFIDNDAGSVGGGISATGGTLQIENSRIEGNSAGSDGGGIKAYAPLYIEDVTITGNSAYTGGGVSISDTSFEINDSDFLQNTATRGGALSISESDGVVAHGTTIVENTAPDGSGGGIYVADNLGMVSFKECTIRDNEAGVRGGGLYNLSGKVEIIDCTIAGSSLTDAGSFGAGIYNGGEIDIVESTISGSESSGAAGGIYTNNQLTMLNSTISGNQNAGGGGMIVFSGTADISFTTITANNTDPLYGEITANSGTVNIKNSIVYSSSGPDCVGKIDPLGDNIDGDGTCGFTYSDNPLLGQLADNGGSTQTHALQAGSPAIDMALDCSEIGGSGVGGDQRGASRPGGAECDLGAYETDMVPPPPPQPSLITTIQKVPCLTGPGDNYPTNMTLDAFQPVTLVGVGFAPGWLVVEADGVNCWVPQEKLEGWTLELLETYPVIALPMKTPTPTAPPKEDGGGGGGGGGAAPSGP